MIKFIAFILMTLGTIGATIGVAQTNPQIQGWENQWQINSLLTLISMALILIGIFMTKMFHAETDKAIQQSKETKQKLVNAVQSMISHLTELQEKLTSIDLNALHQSLDDVLSGPITDFVEERFFLSNEYGTATYAVVMTPFAQGERYLNRAWSASTDGYLEEATDYVKKALPLFTETLEVLNKEIH